MSNNNIGNGETVINEIEIQRHPIEKNFIEKNKKKEEIDLSFPVFDNTCDEESFIINEQTFLANNNCLIINK